MSDLARVTISLEEPLLAAFDKLIAARGYANRSEAIRDRLVREQGEADGGQNLITAAGPTGGWPSPS